MSHILILGATGRAGSATLTALPAGIEVTAALRHPSDATRLPPSRATVKPAIMNISAPDSIAAGAHNTDIIINAIRLRENIPADALIKLHDRILAAVQPTRDPFIITVGGAGSLHLPGGRRFWQEPTFPTQTLPRGIAHAALRDYLESGLGERWAYLIPPPDFDPNGPRTGCYTIFSPSPDESFFTHRAISYAEFGSAVAAIALDAQPGTCLIGA